MDAPTVDRSDQSFIARHIVLIFSGKGKQMSLIVLSDLSIGQHPKQSIEILIAFLDHEATSQNASLVAGHSFHPCYILAVHRFGQSSRIHGKSGREHFG